MSIAQSRIPFIAWAAAAILPSGCASPSYDWADDAYWRNDPESITAAYREAVQDTGRNALLGVEKLLSAALLRQDWQDAESLAIRASTLVNIYIAGQPGERDALSLFGREKDKPFKGEPHERAMVDYHLGVLRLVDGDHEGALAAFRSAMQKDRGSYFLPVEKDRARPDAANVERYLYEDDYASLQFLAAKCCQLLDEPGDAEKLFERANTSSPVMKPLFEQGMDPGTNAIILIEGGRAPYKRRSGPQGSILAYEPGPGATVGRVTLGRSELSFGLVEDLYHQATTLGRRKVDELNRLKAERQEILQLAGFSTAAAGLFIAHMGAHSRNRELQAAGMIGMGVGIGLMIFAATAIDPGADVRAWTTLPGQIYLAVGRAEPGEDRSLRVRARGEGDLSQEWTGVPVKEGLNIYWIRLLPYRRGGPWRPYPRPVGEASQETPERSLP